MNKLYDNEELNLIINRFTWGKNKLVESLEKRIDILEEKIKKQEGINYDLRKSLKTISQEERNFLSCAGHVSYDDDFKIIRKAISEIKQPFAQNIGYKEYEQKRKAEKEDF